MDDIAILKAILP